MPPRIAIDIGIDCGRQSAGFNGDFSTVMPGVVEYRRFDSGLSKTGSIINSVANLAGSAGTMTEHNSSQGIGSVGSGLGGRATLQQNGTNQGGDYSLTLGAPATTNLMFYWIARNPSAAVGNPSLFGDQSANRLVIYRGNATDTLNLFDGSSGPAVAATSHVWHRGAALFTGSTSGNTDILKWGNVAQVTGNGGNGASSSPRTFGYSFQNSAYCPDEWALFIVGNGVTFATFAATLTALDTAAVSWFGSGNFLM